MEAEGAPITGTAPSGPGTEAMLVTWLWPCRINSAPASAITARKRLPSVSRLCRAADPACGGWWMSTTRKRPSRPSRASRSASLAACSSPMRPVAMKGGDDTADETETTASDPRRRTEGKATVLAASPAM